MVRRAGVPSVESFALPWAVRRFMRIMSALGMAKVTYMGSVWLMVVSRLPWESSVIRSPSSRAARLV